MTISKKKNGAVLTVSVSDRLDTVTAPEFEKDVSAALDGITKLILDFSELSYISSAGLRVLLILQKRMNEQGEMKITGVSDMVYEIFEVTGFADILTIAKG